MRDHGPLELVLIATDSPGALRGIVRDHSHARLVIAAVFTRLDKNVHESDGTTSSPEFGQ
jgi:hypothetical protein